MTSHTHATQLSDDALLEEVTRAAAGERRATARLIALLGELDARRLYLAQGCSSLFTYCTRVLHLSEHAAYGRIEAARAARRCPEVLARLADGSLTLTAVTLLAPYLGPQNEIALLDAARHRSKREVEHLVAALRPQPPVAPVVRKLPTAKPAAAGSALPLAAAGTEASSAPLETAQQNGTALRTAECRASVLATAQIASTPPNRPPVVAPLAPDHYKVQFTVGRETYEKLRKAQDLLRHVVPNGDPAVIFDRALTVLLDDLARRKYGAAKRPRARTRGQQPRSRHVPAEVRRAVWARDNGRCAYVAANGRRCEDQGFLEFHHLVPHADGGEATAGNIELRCRAHNAYEAERWFGPLVVREGAAEYGVPELGPDRVGGHLSSAAVGPGVRRAHSLLRGQRGRPQERTGRWQGDGVVGSATSDGRLALWVGSAGESLSFGRGLSALPRARARVGRIE